jgi:probable phosphoglycerate mutase
MLELWVIRRGETAWTISGRHAGRTDVPLTPRGETQARMPSRRIAARRSALVLTSPLSRARETCRLAGRLDAAQAEPDLAERDHGAFEGRTTADVRAEIPGWSLWTGAVPGGETPEQAGARVEAA